MVGWMMNLESVDVSNVAFEDMDVATDAICEAMMNSVTLQTLYFTSGNFTVDQAIRMAAALAHSRCTQFYVGSPAEVHHIIHEAMETVRAKHAVLALESAYITSRSTPAGEFAERNGDHAMSHRVLGFLMDTT